MNHQLVNYGMEEHSASLPAGQLEQWCNKLQLFPEGYLIWFSLRFNLAAPWQRKKLILGSLWLPSFLSKPKANERFLHTVNMALAKLLEL